MELPIQNLLEQSGFSPLQIAKPLLNILQMVEESAVWNFPYRIYRSRAACFCLAAAGGCCGGNGRPATPSVRALWAGGKCCRLRRCCCSCCCCCYCPRKLLRLLRLLRLLLLLLLLRAWGAAGWLV